MMGLLPVTRMTEDELIVRTTDALRAGRLDGWLRGFAASIAKSRKSRTWGPSKRQTSVMRRLVTDLRGNAGADHACEAELIDWDETKDMSKGSCA